MCCPTTRQNSVKNLLVFVVKVTPVLTTIIAKTGGGAHTNINTGACYIVLKFSPLQIYLVVFLHVVSTEHCHVLLWNRVRNGGIQVNVRQLRVVSIVTPEQSNNFIQRFVSFCRGLSQTIVQGVTCWFFFLKIYKSTKCNDMQQCGSCPRGPFCAFAHIESKLASI